MDDLEPELPRQVHAFGAAVEHRLGAHVDRHACDLGQPELAADLRGALEEQHVEGRVLGDQVRRGQPGDPAAHDDDPGPLRRTHLPHPSLASTAR